MGKKLRQIRPPAGVKLPRGAIYCDDGCVYDKKSGKRLGKLQAKGGDKKKAEEKKQQQRPAGSGGAKRKLKQVKPPAGVKLPPGAVLCDDGNVYSKEGKLLGALKSAGKKPNAAEQKQQQQQQQQAASEEKEMVVTDGRKFGLKEGMYVGSQGQVFNAHGQLLGKMNGWTAQHEKFLNDQVSAKKEEKLDVIDGRKFGLQKGTYVGSQGKVFDAWGKEQGRLDGWGAEQEAMLKRFAQPDSAEHPPVVQGTHFGMQASQFVGSGGKVYDQAGALIGSLQGWTAKQEEKFARVLEQSGSAAVSVERKKDAVKVEKMPEVVDGTRFGLGKDQLVSKEGIVYNKKGKKVGHLEGWDMSKRGKWHDLRQYEELKEAYVVGDKVYVGARVIGRALPDGTLVDKNGNPFGAVAGDSLQGLQRAAAAARDGKKKKGRTVDELIKVLLHVPDYHAAQGLESEEKSEEKVVERRRAQSAAHEAHVRDTGIQVARITVPEAKELSELAEPETGVASGDEKRIAQARAQAPAHDVVPSRFTRPYLQKEFSPEQKVVTGVALNNLFSKRVGMDKIKALWISNLHQMASPKHYKRIGELISQLPSLSVLGLVSSNLKELEFKTPQLLRLDVSHNRFSSFSKLGKTLSGNAFLQNCNFQGNPLCQREWAHGIPPVKHDFWNVLLSFRDLDFLNGHFVQADLRHEAFLRHHDGKLAQLVPMQLWQYALNRLPAVQSMRKWTPANVSAVSLPKHHLHMVYVYPLRETLLHVDLSDNHLTTIKGCGFEHCPKLSVLNVARNQIKSVDELHSLSLLSGLREFSCLGNPLPANYREHVIWLTRNLAGTNRVPGLTKLDGQLIPVEERLAVLSHRGGLSNDKVAAERWRLLQIRLYGASQLRSLPGFLGKVRNLRLPGCHLTHVDLSEFTSLQVLDLSNNDLPAVAGLERLTQLRVCFLAENPRLNNAAVFAALTKAPVRTLEQVSFAKSPAKATPAYVRKVFAQLSKTCAKLSAVDGVSISVRDRVALFAQTHKPDHKALDSYRNKLALCVGASKTIGRSYAIEDLSPGVQYDPARVLVLELKDTELTNSVDLRPFVALERLSIRGTKVTDLSVIGVMELKQLEFLDARNCELTAGHSEIAALIDGMPSLHTIAVRGNMHFKSSADIKKLVSSVQRLHNVDCTLRYIDGPIDMNVRVAAVGAGGKDAAQGDRLRWRTALHLRAPDPARVPPSEVKALNLDDMKLNNFDLTEYRHLMKLRLRGNNLRSIRNGGIEKMMNLRVLDVRDNQLADWKEISEICDCLPNLEYVGWSGNRFDKGGAEYESVRQKIIGSIISLRNVDDTLRFMDSTRITGSEVLEGWRKAGGNARERELFHFKLVMREKLPRKVDPSVVNALDLRGSKLQLASFKSFVNLRQLNLDRNKFTSQALLRSGLGKLERLAELSVRNNSLDDLDVFGALIDEMRGLEALYVQGNKICPDNSPESRVRLLASIGGVCMPNFKLSNLNGQMIDLKERTEAVRSLENADNQGMAEYHRTNLLLEKLKVPAHVVKLDLSKRALINLIPLKEFKNIQVLILNNNQIEHVHGQGLDMLPQLTKLDLRNNRIVSVSDLLSGLMLCNRLTHLFMLHSTQDGRTNSAKSYLQEVCLTLRGVQMLDFIASPVRPFNESQLDALAFLYKASEVGINGLVHVDMQDRDIPAKLFFYILSALSHVGITKSLRAHGNMWNMPGKHHVEKYRQFCVHALGERLISLDGQHIGDAERLLAIKSVKQERNMVPEWSTCRAHAYGVLQEQGGGHKRDRSVAGGGLGGAGGGGGGGGGAGHQAGARDPLLGGAAGGLGEGGHGGPKKLAGPMSGNRVNRTVHGTFITKAEIIINFIQIYGLLLIIDLTIPWPEFWLDFSEWVRFFTLDIEDLFNVSVPYKQQIKFACTVFAPLLCVAFYYGLLKVNKARWIDNYIARWSHVRMRSFVLWIFFGFILGFGVAMLADTESIGLVKTMQTPTSRSNSAYLMSITVTTLFYALWYLVVSTFRKHYILDRSARKEKFFEWWLATILWWRRAALFLITILFMPVSRVILEQFYCVCPRDEDEAVLEKLPRDVYGQVDMECQIYVYPSQPCFPEEFTGVQLAAIFFGILYVIGIPYFFYKLIHQGVYVMVDIQGYSDEAERAHEKMAELRAAAQKGYKKEIAKIDTDLHNYYFDLATTNYLPQTYLYAPYERRYRYWKTFQMFQKLFIIACTMFIPAKAVADEFRVLCAGGVVCLWFLTTFIARPFQDNLEDWMEVMSQLTNTVNVICALSLKTGWMSKDTAVYLLVGFNATTILLFTFSLINNPFQICRAESKDRKKKIQLEKQKASLPSQRNLNAGVEMSSLHEKKHR